MGSGLFLGLLALVNAWLALAGAKNRKRCGECTPQENERDRPGSGQAIAIGTIIDALPEGLVLGIAVANGVSPTVAVVAGFFLANVRVPLGLRRHAPGGKGGG